MTAIQELFDPPMHKFSVRRTQGRRLPLYADDTKMEPREVVCVGVDWNKQSQGKEQ